jgi:hypothetical protein
MACAGFLLPVSPCDLSQCSCKAGKRKDGAK